MCNNTRYMSTSIKIDMVKLVSAMERDFKEVLIETIRHERVAPAFAADPDRMFQAFRERMDRKFGNPIEVPSDAVQLIQN